MGKGNKKSNSTTDEGLQTLKKTTVKVIDTTKDKAASFEDQEGAQKSQVKPTRVSTVPPTPPPPVIEEKDLLDETTFTQTIVHKVEEPVVELVYEITFIEIQGQVKKDITVYTKDIPVFKEKNILFASNLFGRENLKEIVLKKKEIKTSCKRPLKQTELELDLRNGVLLKVIPEQPWMNSDYESTKKTFDEMVLKAYRELSSSAPVANTVVRGKRDNIDLNNGRPQILDI